jgi:hypothetical protein
MFESQQSIRTGFFSSLLTVAYLYPDVATVIDPFPLTVITLCVLIYSFLMLALRVDQLARALRARNWMSSVLYTFVLLSLVWMMVSLFGVIGLLQPSTWANINITGTLSWEFMWMMATAASLPLFWQFVDLSNWQRICSLAVSRPTRRIIDRGVPSQQEVREVVNVGRRFMVGTVVDCCMVYRVGLAV